MHGAQLQFFKSFKSFKSEKYAWPYVDHWSTKAEKVLALYETLDEVDNHYYWCAHYKSTNMKKKVKVDCNKTTKSSEKNLVTDEILTYTPIYHIIWKHPHTCRSYHRTVLDANHKKDTLTHSSIAIEGLVLSSPSFFAGPMELDYLRNI